MLSCKQIKLKRIRARRRAAAESCILFDYDILSVEKLNSGHSLASEDVIPAFFFHLAHVGRARSRSMVSFLRLARIPTLHLNALLFLHLVHDRVNMGVVQNRQLLVLIWHLQ